MRKLKRPDQNWVCCAVCLNQRSERVPAEVIVNGLSVCADHIALASNKSFDIFTLQGKRGAV